MICIFTPEKKTSNNIITGNQQTAIRYQTILKNLRINSEIISDSMSFKNWGKTLGFIILHGTKGHSLAIQCIEKKIPYALVLTGTDIYSDIKKNNTLKFKKCLESVFGAKLLIVLQEHAKKEILKIIPELEKKILVIHQSSQVEKPQKIKRKIGKSISVLMIGNFRREKDQLTGIIGFNDLFKNQKMKSHHKVFLTHIGCNLDSGYANLVKKSAKNNKQIKFLGYVNHKKTMEILLKSDLFLNTSIVEGSCLALKEAIDLRVPVLVSNNSCHMTIMGNNYPGFFKTTNKKDLTKKLMMFITRGELRKKWRQKILESPVFDYTRKNEEALLREVVSQLI